MPGVRLPSPPAREEMAWEGHVTPDERVLLALDAEERARIHAYESTREARAGRRRVLVMAAACVALPLLFWLIH